MTKLILRKTIGAAISDLFREKPSSTKALQECVALGSRAYMIGDENPPLCPQEGKLDTFFFLNGKKEN